MTLNVEMEDNVFFGENLSLRTLVSKIALPNINLAISRRNLSGVSRKKMKLMKGNSYSFDVKLFGKIDKSKHENIKYKISRYFNNRIISDLVCADIFEIYDEISKIFSENEPYFSLRSISPSDLAAEKMSVSSAWHRDAAAITLIVCYDGDGTHWTPNSNVYREYFEHRQMQEEILSDHQCLIDCEKFYQLDTVDIAIIKGEMRKNETDKSTLKFYQDRNISLTSEDFNVGGGLIHRGPGMTSKRQRLLFTASFFDPRILCGLP